MRFVPIAAALAAFSASPALAQDGPPVPPGPPAEGETVFDDTWVSIGIGASYGPSYDGSDDYVISVLPVVQGSVEGFSIRPRPAGLMIDLIRDRSTDGGPTVSFGPAMRLRTDRADQIEDPVVIAAGELDRAFEIGPSAGLSFPGVLNPFDSLSVDVDARWDVAGAHGGMVIDPSISYFTPVSRGAAVSLSLGAEYGSDDFADYYYSVSPAQSVASGLPTFQADGGFNSVSVSALGVVDFDGDLTNGGFGAVLIGGYSRLINDAADSPYTSLVGDRDQFFTAVGIAYTF